MDIKEILRAVLSTAYKMTDGEVAELLEKTEAKEVITAILDKDKARIADLVKDKFQDGYAKAKKEVLTEFEKPLREKYGIDDKTLQGDQLIEAIVTKEITTKGGGEPGKDGKAKLTDDDVKKHDLYIQLERKLKTDLEKVEADWKQKYEAQESVFKKEQNFTSVKDKAQNILQTGGFVLPEDATIAANQKELFLGTLRNFEYQTTDGTTVVIDSSTGKRVEDGHGHAVTADDFIKGHAAKYFPIAKNNGGGNAGNGNDGKGGKGGEGGKIETPKTMEELTKIVNDPKIPFEQREDALKEFEDAQQQQ